MANTITAAAPPTTVDVTSQVLATMGALSGVLTDYNIGSQIRTQTESLGAVIEQQSIWTQAIVFQGLVYSAMSLFGITPETAVPASGTVSIQTSQFPAAGVPATQNVPIVSGTIVATVGGFQYAAVSTVLLTAGSSGVSVGAVAVVGGSAGNIATSGVQLSIVSSLSYPLYAVNQTPMSGGQDAETPAQTMARFTALRSSIGLASPGAIANAAIGVQATGTGETVLYSTVYEPWIAAGSASGSGIAGYSVYIDNGTGAASSGLIAAVKSFLNGGMVSGATNAGARQGVGFRDAGVPYNVFAVTPTVANVGVTGIVGPLTTVSAVQSAFNAAISGYFTLLFGATAEQAPLSTKIGNSATGLMNSLTVSLMASGSSTPVTGVGCLPYGRVILGTIALNLTQGT